MAKGIVDVIKSIVYENNKVIVDWQNKTDIEGQIKIAIDDYVFDLKSKYDIELSFDKIDQFVEEGLSVAKIKFV
jgi:type I restriction enzyme R subunit